MADEIKPATTEGTNTAGQGSAQDGTGTPATGITAEQHSSILSGTEESQGTAQQGEDGGEPKGQETTKSDEDPYKSLKLPEGAEVDDKFFTSVKGWAKEHGLKAEGLQKLVDSWGQYAKETMAQQEKEAQEFRQNQSNTWFKELESDKEFGGKNFKENVANVKKLLVKVDQDGSFRKQIQAAGIDNWPPLVRFLNKLATVAKDDSVAGTTGKPTSGQPDEAGILKQMYPTMFKE